MQTEPWNEKLWGLGKTYFFLRLKCKSSLSFSIAFVLSGTLDFKQTIFFSSLGVMTLRLLLPLYLSSGTSANTCHGNEDKKLCFHYPCLAEHSSKPFFQVQNWNRSSGFRQVGKHWMYLTKAQHIACSGRSGQRGNSGVKKLGRPGSGYWATRPKPFSFFHSFPTIAYNITLRFNQLNA